MMQFFARVTSYQKNTMLNICDAEFIGKTIGEGELNMNISENYYGDKSVDQEEAKTLLQKASIINMVGNEIISMSVSLGIGSKNGIKLISGVPFLIVFKM